MRRRSVIVAARLALAMMFLTPAGSLAQGSASAGADLAARLPASIDGSVVEVVLTEDMQTWADAAYPGEARPEIQALQAALADQGLSLADVATLTAYFGADLDGQIQGYSIPGGSAASIQDAIAAVYLIGSGDLERTQLDIGGQAVPVLSDGPIESATYPTALLLDGDALWMVTADTPRLQPALEALLAVAAGEAPGGTSTFPAPEGELGPPTWEGTMLETLKWNKEGYKGQSSATFRGTWERLGQNDINYCPEGPCAVYIPHGTVDWTFESSAPTRPRCHNQRSGSTATGDVVVPRDQMLFLEPLGPDHFSYWGSGTLFLPEVACHGWEGIAAPGSFFELESPEGAPNADESTEARPLCYTLTWRIERDAPTMQGSCWRYDGPGYEERIEWDLRRVEQP